MIWFSHASIVGVCVSIAGFTSTLGGVGHDKDYWRAIVRDGYALPAGESAIALVRELSTYVGSTDPEMRDELAYAISAQWIYRQKLIARDDLVLLMHGWMSNLKQGIDHSGDDGVLLRSFSALDLSIAAALDADQPFLTPEEFRTLLDAALNYLATERDLRGFDRAKGWMHATAHTADLLKFLARSPALAPADQARILSGVADRLVRTGETVFTHGEDERLARAIASIVVRDDFDAAAFEGWLARFRAQGRAFAAAPDFDPEAFAALQNSKNLLKSLFVMLSRAEALPPALVQVRTDVLACLAALG